MSYGPVMIDLDGTTLSAEEEALLQHPAVGGVIYFSRNYESPQQIQQLSEAIHQVRPGLLLAVDQEGGRVNVLSFTRLPPMQRFYPAVS